MWGSGHLRGYGGRDVDEEDEMTETMLLTAAKDSSGDGVGVGEWEKDRALAAAAAARGAGIGWWRRLSRWKLMRWQRTRNYELLTLCKIMTQRETKVHTVCSSRCEVT